MALTFHAGDLDSADVKALLVLHFEQMRSISPPGACHVLPIDGLRDPDVTFWSTREDGALVGVGALKALASDHGEVKSMRTAPQALGRGVGRAILRHIVAEARSRGHRRLSLETERTEPFAPRFASTRTRASSPAARSGLTRTPHSPASSRASYSRLASPLGPC